jgi:hypothetical protein
LANIAANYSTAGNSPGVPFASPKWCGIWSLVSYFLDGTNNFKEQAIERTSWWRYIWGAEKAKGIRENTKEKVLNSFAGKASLIGYLLGELPLKRYSAKHGEWRGKYINIK